MSAAEIIEQIKQLPPEEQRTVFQFVASETTALAESGEPQALPMPRELLEKASDEIFDKYQNLFRKLAQ